MLRFSRSISGIINARQLSIAAASSASSPVDKEALMKLRKRTGYSFVNCRKALLQFGPDKIEEAEKWLKELAKKEGWAKAAKLSNRHTSQGLIGFRTNGTIAAVVELLCETDFVARGENFKALLDQLCSVAVNHVSTTSHLSENKIKAVTFDFETIRDSDGRSLKEIVTLAVGKLGENITVKKLEIFFAPKGSVLYGTAHPREDTNSVQMGKFISVIAMKRSSEAGLFPTEKLAGQICQHIIGMRSESLGEPPLTNEKITKQEYGQLNNEQDELNEFYQGETTQIDENETALLRQSFMLNPSQTVHSYLQGHKAEIVDFARRELDGEN